jgi:hypothetical protein
MLGVAGTALGVAGTALGVAGTALGVAGTALGVAGTALGVTGTALGVAGTALGVAGSVLGVARTMLGVTGTVRVVAGRRFMRVFWLTPRFDLITIFSPLGHNPKPHRKNPFHENQNRTATFNRRPHGAAGVYSAPQFPPGNMFTVSHSDV